MPLNKTRVFLIFVGLIFFITFSNVKARDEINDKNQKEVSAPEKTIIIPKSNFERDSVFFKGSSEKGLKSVMPFYGAPFLNFEIDFDSSNKKVLHAGEKMIFSSNVRYSDDNKTEEIEKIKNECLEDQKKVGGSEVNCQTPTMYSFPHLDDISILAQIWREETDSDIRKLKGDYLVDSFYVLEGANLIKNQKQPLNFEWDIPEKISSGKYYISFFINQNKSFSIFGFPVNVFAPYLRFDFQLEGPSGQDFLIDKNNIKIDGKDYSQILPIPVAEKKDKIIIEVPIKNNSSEDSLVSVKYELQKWTQEDPKDLVKKTEESLDLKAGEEKIVKFDFEPKELDSFMNLKVTAFNEQCRSMIDIHFSIRGTNRGVIRFLGFGLNDEKQTYEPIFCLRNANWTGDFKGKFNLDFVDSEDRIVHQLELEDMIGSEEGICLALENDIVKSGIANSCIVMKGTLKNENDLISDKKEVKFGCDTENNVNTDKNLIIKRIWIGYFILLGLVVSIFLVAISLYLFHKFKKKLTFKE